MIERLLNNQFSKNLFFQLINLPLVNFFYRQIYGFNIDKKLTRFQLPDLVASIEPSNVCNSKCRMCPYPTMKRPKEVMSTALFAKIVDDCLGEGIKTFNLNFYNEPFLDPYIFERIKYLKSKGARVQLFSNASIVDEDCANKILSSGLDRIDFSIDGAKKETYESIRQGLQFEIVVKNVLYLINQKKKLNLQKPKIRVIFVRQELNEVELAEFKHFWEGNADSIIISFDDNRNKTSFFFKDKTIQQTAFPCRKLWSEIIVMSNGMVALCCVDANGEVILGDFNRQTLKEIWNSKKFRQIRKLHLDFKADDLALCKTCVHPYRMNLKSWW